MPRGIARLLLSLAVAGALGVQQQQPNAADPVPARLMGDVLTRGTTVRNLRALTDRIGGRLSGSVPYDRAVAFALERFQEYGYRDAHREPFQLPSRWLRGTERLSVVDPVAEDIPVAQFGWTAATPAGGVLAPVVDIGDGGGQAFANAGAKLAGAIALVHLESLESPTVDAILEQMLRLVPMYERARDAGARALLVSSPRPDNVLYSEPLTFGTLATLPVGTIGHDPAARIARLLEGGAAVRARLALEGTSGPATASHNVVADLPSANGDAAERVLVGAHLDSWDLGQGADDNGVNAMSVIEVARALKAVGAHPARGVRFVLFGGEEQGLLGSLGYARAHAAEMPRLGAVVIMDAGSGRATGFNLGGRPDLVETYRRLLAPLSAFGAASFGTDPFFGSDHFYFMLEGVPALFVNQDLTQYVRHYHAATDTFDRIDAREALINSALFAGVTYALASAPGSLGAHASRETMIGALEAAGVDKVMRPYGQWPPPTVR